jgi:protein phosphatase
MNIKIGAQSDVGKVRQENEDAWIVRPDLGLYIVADGMGGHAGGQVASQLAVETVVSEVIKQQEALREAITEPINENSLVAQIFGKTVQVASEAVFLRAKQDPSLAGMGTTLTAVLILNQNMLVAHVGDSRCYLLRESLLLQITDDHSLVNEQIKAGILSASQARVSRFKNIITRAVGFEPNIAVDTFATVLQDHDQILICSDGLSNLLDDTEMGRVLQEHEPEHACHELIEWANSRGGDDNITVICLTVDSINGSV